MTPLLLTLASIVLCDGGPRIGASGAEVSAPVRFGREFRGFLRLPDGEICPLYFSGDSLELRRARGDTFLFFDCALTSQGAGGFRLGLRAGQSIRGKVRREGDRVILVPDQLPDLWQTADIALEPPTVSGRQ
jgi:hypothetical protein